MSTKDMQRCCQELDALRLLQKGNVQLLVYGRDRKE